MRAQDTSVTILSYKNNTHRMASAIESGVDNFDRLIMNKMKDVLGGRLFCGMKY